MNAPNQICIGHTAFIFAASFIEIMRYTNIGASQGGSPVRNEKITFKVEYPDKETNTNLF